MKGYDPVYDVSGKVAVITGGCGKIGRVAAKALVERGAKVALADRAAVDPGGLAADLGENAMGVDVDVSRADSVQALHRTVLERFGTVDVLINSHQYIPPGFLESQAEDFPESLWDDIVGVNLKGTFLTCRDFGRTMLEKGRGSIINLASTYGVVSSNPALYADNSMGNPLAYSASKGGVVMLTRYLGAYWASRGVRVNAVSPHGIGVKFEESFERRFSAMSPMHRVMRAEEIVGAIVFLASEASSYVTGSNLLVEGGWTAW